MTAEIKGLHVLTDPLLAKPRPIAEVIEQAIKGGAAVIQFRYKTADRQLMITLGGKIRALTAGRVPLIVNDDVYTALAISADGVHVGQKDMPASRVRQLIGPNMILGVSASTIEEAIRAERDGADYLGVGPIFPTSTKIDADPPIGLSGLSDIREAVTFPIIAIGGINKTNARQVMQFADGIAVISAVMTAEDPMTATSELVSIIMKAKK